MICWINPATGLAGDMLLAALLDAGAPLDAVRDAITATGLTGWNLTTETITDHGLSATRVHVQVHDHATHRAAADLITLASRATPAPVADVAVRALTAIARTEGRLHGIHPDHVHLHELGGHDTLVDIVGVAAALHALRISDLICAPLPLATGTIRCTHGLIPAPAPATLALLAGAAVTGTTLTGETVTPTAAALLHAVPARYGPLPPMTLGPTGYGAGTRRLPDRANIAAVTLGAPAPGPRHEEVTVLETNLDDVTGETLAHTLALALTEGALDAWTTPAVMKKGRPAHILHLLTLPQDADRLTDLVLAQTASLGMRRTPATRTALPRHTTTVHLQGHPVRIKHGPHHAKPEHDDVAAAARHLGLPLRTAAERALRATTPTHPPQDDHGHP